MNRRRIVLSLALALAGAAPGAQTPGANHFLDLVSYLHSPRPIDASVRLLLPGATLDFDREAPAADAKVELTLASVEGDDFAWGDECTYEIVVKNIGGRAIAVPWTPDPFVLPAVDRVVGGSIALEISTPGGAASPPIALQPLFGSRSVSGTLTSLEPGESAQIRVRGAFRSASSGALDDLLRDQSSAAVSIKARFDLYDEGVFATSSNAVPVTLSRPVR